MPKKIRKDETIYKISSGRKIRGDSVILVVLRPILFLKVLMYS